MSTPLGLRWRIVRSEEADAQFAALGPERKRRIKDALQFLADGPYVKGSKKLDQYDNLWSHKVNDWRIVYEPAFDAREIRVQRIMKRPTAYEGLRPRRPGRR